MSENTPRFPVTRRQVLVLLGAGATSVAARAASASGATQARQYRRSRAALEKLLALARAADAKGTLGVSLGMLEQPLVALLSALPGA